MYRAKKPLLCDLNEHLICKLCKGYFVDATTIIECLHTFCRSCIVKYLGSTKYCPVCDVQVHKSKPLLSLRQDKIIQDAVYKLVPRLYHNELRQRKEYHKKHPGCKLSTSEESFEASYGLFLTPEEELSVTLTYYGSLGKPRYLRCPSAVSVMVLQKLIRAKFDLSDSHHVDILHNQDCLSPLYTLMDIIYIYKLSKLEPLDLTYRIYEYMAKKMKLENQECKSEEQTDITLQTPASNNNNWKEVQLRISENGEMSITGIQDDLTSQSFSKEMMEVLDSKPKSPSVNTTMNSVKNKEIPELKVIAKPPQSSKCINILSDTILRPHSLNTRMNDSVLPNVGNNGVYNVIPPVNVPSMNSTTNTVYTTVNSTKCSVGPAENKVENNSIEVKIDISDKESIKESIVVQTDVKLTSEKIQDKGVKRKYDNVNIEDSKKQTDVANVKKIDQKSSFDLVNDTKSTVVQSVEVKTDYQKTEEKLTSTIKNEVKSNDKTSENMEILTKKKNCTQTEEKLRLQTETTPNIIQNNVKRTVPSRELLSNCNSNNNSKRNEEVDLKLIRNNKNSMSPNPTPPKPSTKYQGGSQPCYMPKTTFNPVLNIPKLLQSTVTSKNEAKTSSKALSHVKNDVKTNSSLSSSSSSTVTSNSSSATKQKFSTKLKSNAPIGYKTLKDPPKSWNSQISKANLNKAQPDPKYSDLKNVRPAKFFKMRNNMLRFLGNPASGVKPMYSVHANSEQDKPQEKVVENREIKKHSIVKIDPKTLKPISEKAPETTSLSSQVSTMADLKINTSSVSIFNPLKLQSNSPKSDRKSPKSPQSPRNKSSPSPSPPVLKRDKPNLNFTPPNPFIPNLSSQTINPNQFLCNPGPPGFPSYDPRVMAAYHNLFYGPTMGFAPNPLSYHLGGLDITQRGKGFDISKIVGLQQQASSSKSPSSPQGTSKLDVPMVPPQVPYQPRPNPMSSRPSNVTSVTKRSHKDLLKNEKSLQNTVEKLTLSRAKEIHRAAEALSKLNSADANKLGNKEPEKKKYNQKDDKRASRIPAGIETKENHKETKTSLVEEKAEMKMQQTQNAESTNIEETKPTDNINSEKSDKASAKTEHKLRKEPNSSERPGEAPKKYDEDNLCKMRDNVESTDKRNSIGTSEIHKGVNNTDNTLGTSGDSRKKDDNVNDAEINAGSEKLDGVAGDN